MWQDKVNLLFPFGGKDAKTLLRRDETNVTIPLHGAACGGFVPHLIVFIRREGGKHGIFVIFVRNCETGCNPTIYTVCSE